MEDSPIRRLWEDHKVFLISAIVLVVVFIIVMIILTVLHFKGKFKMEGYNVYNDAIANQSGDPVKFLYFGDNRDILGSSPREYYLENQMNYETGMLPQSFGEQRFLNQSNYMDMPIQYRPLRNPSPGKMYQLSLLVGNDLEEEAYDRLNSEGFISN